MPTRTAPEFRTQCKAEYHQSHSKKRSTSRLVPDEQDDERDKVARALDFDRPQPTDDVVVRATEETPHLPFGWDCRVDASGNRFYVNHNDQTTQWKPPTPTQSPPPPPVVVAEPVIVTTEIERSDRRRRRTNRGEPRLGVYRASTTASTTAPTRARRSSRTKTKVGSKAPSRPPSSQEFGSPEDNFFPVFLFFIVVIGMALIAAKPRVMGLVNGFGVQHRSLLSTTALDGAMRGVVETTQSAVSTLRDALGRLA